MEHLALYRKYRPRTFDDVCGQEHITSVLKYESKCGRLSHAYLFCGPRGTGKTTCAKILAKAVNCERPVDGNPCGKCSHCVSIDEAAATDVLEMDAASNTGVDYIRDIRDEAAYTPAVMKKRVYIIDEVHMLSIGAFNALLKTLEEPPEHVLFILATTEQHKLPATIVSRCQRFDFRRISISDISDRLLHIAELENISLDKTAAGLIAKQAGGGMRDAINLFELCAGGGHDVTPNRVREALGISGTENAYNVAAAVKGNNAEGLFSAVAEVVRSSKDIAVFWQELISFWRDMLVAKNTPSPDEYLELTESDSKLLREAASFFSTAELIYHAGLLDDAMLNMNRLPQIKRNIAELTLVKMSSPALSTSSDALAARITSLEDKLRLMESARTRPVNQKEKNGADATGLDDETHDRENSSISCTPDDSSSSASYSRSSDLVMSEFGMASPPDSSVENDRAVPSGASENKNKAHGIASSANSFIPLRENGELIEKISSLNPIVSSFVKASRLYVNGESNEIIVKCPNDFTAGMLSDSDAMRTLSDSFVLCGVTDSAPKIRVEVGVSTTEGDPLSELDDV